MAHKQQFHRHCVTPSYASPSRPTVDTVMPAETVGFGIRTKHLKTNDRPEKIICRSKRKTENVGLKIDMMKFKGLKNYGLEFDGMEIDRIHKDGI